MICLLPWQRPVGGEGNGSARNCPGNLFGGNVQGNFGGVGCVAQLVERRSLTGELSLSCARHAADG